MTWKLLLKVHLTLESTKNPQISLFKVIWDELATNLYIGVLFFILLIQSWCKFIFSHKTSCCESLKGCLASMYNIYTQLWASPSLNFLKLIWGFRILFSTLSYVKDKNFWKKSSYGKVMINVKSMYLYSWVFVFMCKFEHRVCTLTKKLWRQRILKPYKCISANYATKL